MIFGKTKLELKVGVFVFIGLVILTVFILLIGNFKTWTAGQHIYVTFHFTNGVEEGAPVRFSGVDVGEVKALSFIPSSNGPAALVKIKCWVDKRVNIPADSSVWVNTLGLLGEKYVEIIPGEDYSKLLTDNDVLAGNDPVPMHEILQLAKTIADDIDDAIVRIKNKEGTLGKLLYDDALYQEIETAIKHKDGTVGRFLYDDSIYKEVEGLIADLRAHPWKLFWKTKEKKR